MTSHHLPLLHWCTLASYSCFVHFQYLKSTSSSHTPILIASPKGEAISDWRKVNAVRNRGRQRVRNWLRASVDLLHRIRTAQAQIVNVALLHGILGCILGVSHSCSEQSAVQEETGLHRSWLSSLGGDANYTMD